MAKNIISLAIVTGATFVLLGCGGGGGSSDPVAPAAKTVTGQFIDTYVEGLNYTCSSGTTGVTNSGGEYTCNVGDSVEFSLGGYILGSTTASSGVVSPETLYPNNPGAALDVAQLLQTLDDDNDPSNGITIPDGYTDLDAVTARPGDGSFDADIEAELGEPLVDEHRAQAHMDETQLRLLFTGKTFYTTIWDDIGTMESWTFNADLTSSTWTELVGGSATGTGSLVIDGMTMTFTCTSDSEQACETDPTIIEVKEILTDYIVVEVRGGELGIEIETLRLYFDEAKAREYLLAGPPTVDLATLLAGKTFYHLEIGDDYLDRMVFNTEVNSVAWTGMIGDDIGETGAESIRIEGNKLYHGQEGKYITLEQVTVDYLLFKGEGDAGYERFYFDETKAREYLSNPAVAVAAPSVNHFENMISGQTLYQVWYGMGVDANGDDIDNVAVLAKVTFDANGSAEYVGLMNEESGSGKWEVTDDKLVLVGTSESFDYSEYNQYVSGDFASGCIQTNWVNENNASDNNVDLFFTDETTARNYANTLTSTTSCP